MRVFVSSVFRSILSHQIDGVRKEKERLIAAQHIPLPAHRMAVAVVTRLGACRHTPVYVT